MAKETITQTDLASLRDWCALAKRWREHLATAEREVRQILEAEGWIEEDMIHGELLETDEPSAERLLALMEVGVRSVRSSPAKPAAELAESVA